MLYRAAMIGIIAFWLVMMGLLVRLETHPEATDIMDVPVSYVMRIIFKHAQLSFLTVTNETKTVGNVSLRPSTTGSNARALNFSGALSIQMPMGPPQRFNFNGAVNMDGALRVLDFRLDLSTRQPVYHLSVNGDAASNTLTYEWSTGNQRTAPQTLPMNAAAFGPALAQNLGLDLHGLSFIPSSIAGPVITARETQIGLRGEQLEVYEVTVNEGGATMLDFYVTELGQIALAKTNFGYTFSSEDWQ